MYHMRRHAPVIATLSLDASGRISHAPVTSRCVPFQSVHYPQPYAALEKLLTDIE